MCTLTTWTDLPSEIRQDIISFNPSLRELHCKSLHETLYWIRRMRRDRQCVICSRNFIFENNPIERRPSTRMYILMSYNATNHVRVRCACSEHADTIQDGEFALLVPRESEFPSEKFKTLMISVFDDLDNIIVHYGVDEDDIRISTSIIDGNETITREHTRPTWKRVSIR